jgi:hypothetical protein
MEKRRKGKYTYRLVFLSTFRGSGLKHEKPGANSLFTLLIIFW